MKTQQVTLSNGDSAIVVVGIDALKGRWDVARGAALLEELIEGGVDSTRVDVLKESACARVWRVRNDGEASVICRSFQDHALTNRLRRAMSMDAPSMQWRRMGLLCDAGVPTAQPLAFYQPRNASLPTWLVTSEIVGTLDLDRIALTELPRLSAREAAMVKRRLFGPIVNVLCRMAESGLSHRDMKASNLLVTDWLGDPVVWIVDVEGVRRRANGLWASIVRLAASLVTYRSVTRTDGIRFLRAYLHGVGADPGEWRRHFRLLVDQSKRRQKRSLQRKGDRLDAFGS